VKSSHKGAKSYTSNVSHNQTLGEILDWSSWEGVGREGLKLWRCFNGVGVVTLERRKKEYLYPLPPGLAVGGCLRPGRVTRLPPEPSRVARPLMSMLTDKRRIPLRSASVRTPHLFHHGIPKVLVNPRSKGITRVRSTTTH
jgi:hypothetical protein